MKAFIQRTFMKEKLNHSIIYLKSNQFFTNNSPFNYIKSFNKNSNDNSTSLISICNNQRLEKGLKDGVYSNGLIKHSKKAFSKNSTQWLNRHTNDVYVKKSVEMNYKSRAAFKLIEIQNKYKILKKGQKVIDIGSAPGGWSQVISELVHSNKSKPDVIAVDILKMDQIDGVCFIQGDLTRKEIQERILEKNNFEKFDVVLSDMCPEFVGQKYKDHFNLIKLNEMTIEFGSKILKTNGILVMKTFEGTMQKKLQEGIDLYFDKIQRFKPASSRSESSELYLICTGYMQNQKLKSEIEKIQNTDINEFIEKKKNDAVKNYKFKKFDKDFEPDKLAKLRDDIINIFKVDPEGIKVTKEEEEEIIKIVEEEKKEFHYEYFGSGYYHNPKNFSELIELFMDDQRKHLAKLKEMTLSEKMDENAAESYLKADSEVKHLEELAKAQMKEIQFMDRMMEKVNEDVQEYEKDDLERPDKNPNKLIKKFQKWEKFLSEEKEKQYELFEESVLERKDEIQNSLQREEDGYLKTIQNEFKNRKRTKFSKSLNREAVSTDKKPDTDIFFQKSKKNK